MCKVVPLKQSAKSRVQDASNLASLAAPMISKVCVALMSYVIELMRRTFAGLCAAA